MLEGERRIVVVHHADERLQHEGAEGEPECGAEQATDGSEGDPLPHDAERQCARTCAQRAQYAELVAHPERIEEVLQAGADKARRTATPFIAELRQAVGLRKMVAVAQPAAKVAADKQALPQIKQYRETDGLFYFKLTTHQGSLLLQSTGLADGREAGNWVKRLKTEGEAALADAPVARAKGVDAATVAQALAALVEATRQAEAEKAAKAAQA